MSRRSPVDIIGVGAVTPIGGDAVRSAAAARAGVCGFREHPFMVDTAGVPMCVARVPWLRAGAECAERVIAMLVAALEQALAVLPDKAGPVPLALALPPVRPGRRADLADQLEQALGRRFRSRLQPIVRFETGHAAGLQAVDEAMTQIASGGIACCLVAGVDTYLEPATLDWLEACDQLHGAGPLNNAWGFIPGEAAGVILLASQALSRQAGIAPLGEIVGIGIGRESKLIKTDAVCIGEGLTAAFRAALDDLPPAEIVANVMCDMNGEAYRADEYGFTALRTRQRFRAATDFISPADCWGDVGAASATLHVMMALHGCAKGYGHGPVSLVCGSSEGGERGAAVVRAAFSERR